MLPRDQIFCSLASYNLGGWIEFVVKHVQIFCFLASYTVALALELSRLWFRSGIRGIVMLGFVVAGWIAHTAFLYNSAIGLRPARRCRAIGIGCCWRPGCW